MKENSDALNTGALRPNDSEQAGAGCPNQRAQETQPAGQNATPESPVCPAKEGEDLERLTQEEIRKLQQIAAEAEKNRELLLRVAADFENYKKRVAKERQQTAICAKQELIAKLLPILDNFELALSHADNIKPNGQGASNDIKAIRSGIEMIYQQFRNVLFAEGLEEINAIGQVFDPFYHEAVGQEMSAEVPEGHVIRQVRKGYKFAGKILRPAVVVVAAKATTSNCECSPERAT